MTGFFSWVRRKTHGTSSYETRRDEPFDDDTQGMFQGSLALLENMRSQSLDLSKRRQVSHLFLGMDANLARAAKLFSEQRYSIEEQSDGRLLLSEQIAVTDDWVRRVVPAMRLTAGEFDLIYDGWDVDVAADHTGQDN